MNFHNDDFIMGRVQQHYNDALKYFPENRIVCLVLQGSQNYGLDVHSSDVDTRLIVCPEFYDLAMNRQPVSTTHIRQNDEHIDFKDVRLALQLFKKQNLNFLECLFSPYSIVNPFFADEWNKLLEAREEIARYNPIQAVKSMQGLAHTKYKQLEHDSPAHADDIQKYGYSPKEFHHLLRIEEYIARYIKGEPYADCIVSNMPATLKEVKCGVWDLYEVRERAENAIARIDSMADKFSRTCDNVVNTKIDALLANVQYKIMEFAIKKELGD